MISVPDTFDAFVAEKIDDRVERGVDRVRRDILDGDVAIRVQWSGVNYKDALATIQGGGVARISPLIAGIDLAGIVVESASPDLRAGTEVLVHGYDLGVGHHGGYAEYARVPADWVIPLPTGMSMRDAMGIGTAGFTAALSVQLLEEQRVTPASGPVLVVGATGGVGSAAVQMLSQAGYDVVASSGKAAAYDWLRELGASDVIPRAETSAESPRPLESQRWAGVVDPVGGETLAYALRTLRYGGSVATSGNTGGAIVQTSVFPFILRGARLIGVDSVQCPRDVRVGVWRRLSEDLRPHQLDSTLDVIGLDGLSPALDKIHAGGMQGRTLVHLDRE